jgi:hypothetical protein
VDKALVLDSCMPTAWHGACLRARACNEKGWLLLRNPLHHYIDCTAT